MTIAALKENRASKIAEMKAMGDKPDAAAFDKLEAETRALTADIGRAETLAEFERQVEAPANDNEVRSLVQGFSVAKAISESLAGKLTGREAEYAAESARASPVPALVSRFPFQPRRLWAANSGR